MLTCLDLLMFSNQAIDAFILYFKYKMKYDKFFLTYRRR